MITGTENSASTPRGVGRARLPRRTSLKRRALIRALFDRNRSDVFTAAAGSVRILARAVPVDEAGRGAHVQSGFAAGKMKGAVRRNRIRRLLREAYRVRRNDLVDVFPDESRLLTLMILYRGDPDPSFDTISTDLDKAISRLSQDLKARLATAS